MNLPQYDNRIVRFGFTLSGTSTQFHRDMSPEFLKIDTLQRVEVKNFSGFGLGAIADFRIGQYLNLRFLPSISFAQRNIIYTFTNPAQNKEVKIESVYLELPVLLKYKTQRHRNIRFYLVGGVRYSYDLASNIDAPRSIVNPVVALKPNTLNYEIGAGLDMYFPFFKLSPELKITHSFGNVMVKDEMVYTKALAGLFSRIITFSFHFE